MGKAISGKKKKTQRKKAKPEFAHRRNCSVPPGQHCSQYKIAANEREAKKFRSLRKCATSEEDTDPGVEVYNKYWTLEQQKEADKKIKQILQEGERALVCLTQTPTEIRLPLQRMPPVKQKPLGVWSKFW